jgi:hypothetical protein
MARTNTAEKLFYPEDTPAKMAKTRSKRPLKRSEPVYEEVACESCGDYAVVRYDIHTHCETCGSTKAHS